MSEAVTSQGKTDAPSAPEVAYAWIRQFIVDLPREDDAFLNEVALAKATQTSRTPVREALMRLESEGLLRRIPRKGAYVPPVTDADLRALMEARSLAEMWAAERAAEAVRDELAVFQSLIDEQRDAIADKARFIQLDIEFHRRMVHLARNPLLEDFYDSLRLRQSRVGVRAVSNGDDRAGEVLREHQAILDAIAAADHSGASDAIREHLDSTLVAVLQPR